MPWIPRILRYNFLSVSVHFLSLSLFNGPIVFRGKDKDRSPKDQSDHHKW